MVFTKRNVIPGTVCAAVLAALLAPIAAYLAPDAAAAAGAVAIWIVGLGWCGFCLLGDPRFPRHGIGDGEDEAERTLRRLIHGPLRAYWALVLIPGLLGGFWVGLTARHWLLLGGWYFALDLAAVKAGEPRRPWTYDLRIFFRRMGELGGSSPTCDWRDRGPG